MSEFRQFPAWEAATLAELREERDYWRAKLDEATGWGAAVGAANGFLEACEAWIRKRERESAPVGRNAKRQDPEGLGPKDEHAVTPKAAGAQAESSTILKGIGNE